MSALASLLTGREAEEFIDELARLGLQQLIELEVVALLAAGRCEQGEECCGNCNGSRLPLLITKLCDIQLVNSKFRSGCFCK